MHLLFKRFGGKAGFAAGFVLLALLFSLLAWTSNKGFHESRTFPNYGMLTSAIWGGGLDLDEHGLADQLNVDGRYYLYSGPAPALCRMLLAPLAPGRTVPTGIMNSIYSAGACIFFILCLNLVAPDGRGQTFRTLRIVFSVVIIANGFTLFMVSHPTFHNEAVCSAMCFLMASIFLLLKIQENNFKLPAYYSCLLGLTLALSFASRFSYVFSAAFIAAWFAKRLWAERSNISPKKIYLMLGPGFCILLLALGGMLLYNYARFGEFLEFGMKYQGSMYRDYYQVNGFFRYDHIPHNIWALFFKIPEFSLEFPFMKLQSTITAAKTLFHGEKEIELLMVASEASASIFILAPITLFAVAPFFISGSGPDALTKKPIILLGGVFVLQIALIAMTVNTVTRFYFDFLPIMLLMSFLGAARMKMQGIISTKAIIAAVGLTLILSNQALISALEFYNSGGWSR